MNQIRNLIIIVIIVIKSILIYFNSVILFQVVLNQLNCIGCYQEYAIVTKDRIIHKPESISFIQAASLGIAFISAWLGLIPFKESIINGINIYIPGGSGGVGHYAINIINIWSKGKSQIITSTSNFDSINILIDHYSINPNNIINYKFDNINEKIMKLTNNNGVDIIYDSTYNKFNHLESINLLSNNGNLMILGELPLELLSNSNSIEYSKLLTKSINLMNCCIVPYSTNKSNLFSVDCLPALIQAIKWIELGLLKPWIYKIIEFNELITLLSNQLKWENQNLEKLY